MLTVYVTMTLLITMSIQISIWIDDGALGGMMELPGRPNLLANVTHTLLCLCVLATTLFWAYLAGFEEVVRTEHKTWHDGKNRFPVKKWHQLFLGIGVIKMHQLRRPLSDHKSVTWEGKPADLTITSFLLNRMSQACGCIIFVISYWIVPAWTLPLVLLSAMAYTFYNTIKSFRKDIEFPFPQFLRIKFFNYLTNVGVATGTVAGLYITAVASATAIEKDCMRVHIKFPEGVAPLLLNAQDANIILQTISCTAVQL